MEGWKAGQLIFLVVETVVVPASSCTLITQDTITSTLEYYGNPVGHSAMAYLVGLPCGIATQLIIDGKFDGKTGVLAPYSMDIVEPIKAILESEGVTMIEKTL